MSCTVTVFTPAYNRAYTLERLYNSLVNQTCFDFEWLIVDDGSTDNTKELVDGFLENNNQFSIRYFFQNNSGKHVAINKGVDLANGYLFLIVDSDDYLIDTAIEKIIKWESTIKDKYNYAGVSGNKGYANGEMIGDTFRDKFVDATSLEREKYSIIGDKSEVFYTNVLKQYPFPVYDGEKFITETVVWYKIAAEGYKIRWFNEIIYIAEYLDDGLSFDYTKLYANNPKGFALSVKQNIEFLNYNKSRVNIEYCNYYQIVKENTSIKQAADYLGIKQTTLLKAIFLFYIGVAKRKIIRKKNDKE